MMNASQISAAPAPHPTHQVVNQAPPRVDLNELDEFPVLVDALRRFGAEWSVPALHDIGAIVGSAEFQSDAARAHAVPPVLESFDRWGRRIDTVRYQPGYHRILGSAVAHGAHTLGWTHPRPGAHVARAATFFLFSQIEPGHACPISMTHAAVPVLRHNPELAERWLPRLYSREYDATLTAPGLKTGALLGMAMTEKQGGSDIRQNSTLARHASGEDYLLTGHKWFCSAPMSDAFLVLAQTQRAGEDRGISCFLVPRFLEDGTRNPFYIMRLKDKLGNRSNASSEIELDGTVGHRIGEEGRGVGTIIDMVARTRLDCVIGSASGMRQAVSEALWHAEHRAAFGARLVDQPAMSAVLADLALESEAATLTALRLAAAHEDTAGEADIAFRRLATAVGKFWVCKRGPQHAAEALECLGGNGYTEAFPLAMRYREQPVMAVWEGSGNVIALDVLRTLGRTPDSAHAFFAELGAVSGVHPLLDAHIIRTSALLSNLLAAPPELAQAGARGLVEHLALALQSALMLQFAPDHAAETFIATRLGEDRGHGFGVLPRGTRTGEILARHRGGEP